jgi:hypothetical protein
MAATTAMPARPHPLLVSTSVMDGRFSDTISARDCFLALEYCLIIFWYRKQVIEWAPFGKSGVPGKPSR